MHKMGYKAVRSGRWKYIHYLELEGMDELYDLQADPYEMKNVIADRAASAALDAMKKEMETAPQRDGTGTERNRRPNRPIPRLDLMLILLQQLTQDMRFGVRTFVRTPGFTTLAVLSLALGIMATTAMYSVIHAVVLDPFPYKDVDALMSVQGLESGAAGVPHELLHRPVPRDRRAQHDLRRHHRLDHLRRALDRTTATRSACAATTARRTRSR